MILIFTIKCAILATNYNKCNLIAMWVMKKLLYITEVINHIQNE